MKSLFFPRFLVVGLFSLVFVAGKDEFDFKFETLTVDFINPSEYFGRDELLKNLTTMADETKKRLCVEAKEHARLDGFDSETGIIYHLDHYNITITVKENVNETVSDVLLRCETIPRSYLRLDESADYSADSIIERMRANVDDPDLPSGESITATIKSTPDDRQETVAQQTISDPIITSSMKQMIGDGLRVDKKNTAAKVVRKVTILLRKNKFLFEPYVLNLVPVVAPPEPTSPSSSSEVRGQKMRYKLYAHDRLDVCVAAKKQVVDVVSELKRAKIEEPTAFDFLLAINRKETQMAIDCLSVPPMYVHFREPISSGNSVTKPIDVMWVKKGLAPALQVDETRAESRTETNRRTAARSAMAWEAPFDRMETERESEVNRTIRGTSDSTDSESAAQMEE